MSLLSAGAGEAEGIVRGGDERTEVAAEVADVPTGPVDESAGLQIADVREEGEAASAQATAGTGGDYGIV